MYRQCQKCGAAFDFRKTRCPQCGRNARPLPVGVAGIFLLLGGIGGLLIGAALAVSQAAGELGAGIGMASCVVSVLFILVARGLLQGKAESRYVAIFLLFLAAIADLLASSRAEGLFGETTGLFQAYFGVCFVRDALLVILVLLDSSRRFCTPLTEQQISTRPAPGGQPGSPTAAAGSRPSTGPKWLILVVLLAAGAACLSAGFIVWWVKFREAEAPIIATSPQPDPELPPLKLFTSEEGGFEVLLPGDPVEGTVLGRLDNKQITIKTSRVVNGRRMFYVLWADWPRKGDIHWTSVWSVMVKPFLPKVVSSSPTSDATVGGYPAEDVHGESIYDGKRELACARICSVDNRAYVVFVLLPKVEGAGEQASKVIESFKPRRPHDSQAPR